YNDILTGDANGNSIDGGAGADLITGGAGNDTFTGGTGVDTFLFSNASNGVEVDTITDWGIENGDKLSGSMGAGDQLNVQFGSQTSFIDNDVTVVSQGTGGSASVVEFNDHYDVGDVVTLTIAGLSISRPVKAGATSGYDVALSFEDVLDNITLNTIDADLVNGTSASSVTQLGTNGGGQLRIANDSGENGVFTVTKAVTNASGIVFDAYEDGTVGIAAVNGVVSVIGGVGDDTITGGIGNDTITGALGDDTFNVISGTDTITDLSGFDVLKVSVGATANAAVTANFVATGATSNAGTANLTLSNDVDVDLVLAGGGVGYTITASGNVAASSIFGSQDADTITGGLGNDLIWGASGNDILTGGNGDDTFGGDQGDDTVTGGSGNDFFVVNFGTDAITDFGGSDVLTVGGGATANAAVTANFVATGATSNA
ncbi:MAG: hypothetical protein JZU70_00355, partial [Chlorobium sp.]|nr:hypothetical protein [Chlorobium sp.]